MEIKVDSKLVRNNQEKEYNEALKNDDYVALVKKLKIDENTAKKNTIKLFDSLEELSNCKGCKNIYECKNKVKGHVYFPETKMSNIVFTYKPCKYQKKAMQKTRETNASILDNASFKGIKEVKNTKSRMDVIKKNLIHILLIKDYIYMVILERVKLIF